MKISSGTFPSDPTQFYVNNSFPINVKQKFKILVSSSRSTIFSQNQSMLKIARCFIANNNLAVDEQL